MSSLLDLAEFYFPKMKLKKKVDASWDEPEPVFLISQNISQASEIGLLHEVRYWLKRDPENLFDRRDGYYTTPLYLAALKGHLEIVRVLWTEVCKYYAKKFNLWHPIPWLTFNRADDLYHVQNKLKISSEIYFKSKDVYLIFGRPLLAAAEKGHLKIVKYLITNVFDINQWGGMSEKTALHCASEKGHYSVVEALIKGGANVDCQDKVGLTPLFYAIEMKRTEIVKLLLNSGADVNYVSSLGRTPLFEAAEFGCKEILLILLKAGAKVNHFDNKKRTAFHYAASWNYIEVAKILLKNGAKVYINDKPVQYTDAETIIYDYITLLRR